MGKSFFANYNCVTMDHTEVYIGNNVLLGPNVSILTVVHPLDAAERRIREESNSFEPRKRGNYELIAPVTIGNDVWIAAGSIICPGVAIGDNSVIGARSIVTRDIPANVFVCSTPCRVIRTIPEEERIMNAETL